MDPMGNSSPIFLLNILRLLRKGILTSSVLRSLATLVSFQCAPWRSHSPRDRCFCWKTFFNTAVAWPLRIWSFHFWTFGRGWQPSTSSKTGSARFKRQFFWKCLKMVGKSSKQTSQMATSISMAKKKSKILPANKSIFTYVVFQSPIIPMPSPPTNWIREITLPEINIAPKNDGFQ